VPFKSNLRRYREYSIAYLDSGHGHKEGLSEIELKNAAGKFLTSKEANIGSVTSQITMPAADASWGAVSLMNKVGAVLTVCPQCTRYTS
jgi:hypothetical protein